MDARRDEEVRRVATRHVARLADRPLLTAARTAAGATVLLAVLAIATSPDGLDRLASAGSVGDVVALFGGPVGFAVAVVLAVPVAFFGSLWGGVVADLRRGRR